MKYIINIIRVLFFALFIILLLKGKMMLWLGLYGLSLLVALLFGRLYCGYVCPMNTVMIPTEWLSKKLKIQAEKTPKWLNSAKLSWLALVISIGVMIFSQKILDKSIPILLIWLGGSVLITLRYKSSVFHNLICPFGPFQKAFVRFAKFSERVDEEKCIGCRMCEKVCPSEAIEVKTIEGKTTEKKAQIEKSLCLQCSNCKQICPKDAIS